VFMRVFIGRASPFHGYTAHMPDALTLPDLDALDHAALKAIIVAQLAHRETYTAQHQADTAALTSRASEIAHLKLLVAKLQRMLFGVKSEKVLHHRAARTQA
jgi:transposase